MAEIQSAVLSSWKEIAAYLGKGVRTVQRWEGELGLPVHRPVAHNQRIVIAVPSELDEWIQQQLPQRRTDFQRGHTETQFAKMRVLVAKMKETTQELAQRTKALLEATGAQRSARNELRLSTAQQKILRDELASRRGGEDEEP